MSFSDFPSPAFLVATAAAGLLLAVVSLWRLQRQSAALRAAVGERNRAQAGEQAAIRTLRLAAIELRPPAMSLLGHAEHLARTLRLRASDDSAAHSAAIAGITIQVLNLADELQDHAVGEPAARVLHPEDLRLEPMLRDAIIATESTLGPSRRHWRLAPELTELSLLADRRALAQVLTRVLGNAARLSRDRDWIDIRPIPAEDGVALAIEDEGAGLPECLDGDASVRLQPASRGVGLGLALARTLMQAHGGTLTIESTSGVGSRVVLKFPATCAGGSPSPAA